jgi:hypothetical protein
MAGLQTILNYCDSVEIDRRKVVGIQFTRNEIPRVSQTPTKNPWKFTVSMPSRFRYSQIRDLMEALDTLDRIGSEVITFSNLPQLSWVFAYQGSMSQSMINTITVTSYVNDQLTLTNLPVIPATRVLFQPNDLIQIGNNPYPFTSVNQVLRGTGSSVTFTVSRPNILTTTVVGDGITVGNACEWNVFCPNMPTYKLVPGGQLMSGRTITNNALIEWSDNFVLYEQVGAA